MSLEAPLPHYFDNETTHVVQYKKNDDRLPRILVVSVHSARGRNYYTTEGHATKGGRLLEGTGEIGYTNIRTAPTQRYFSFLAPAGHGAKELAFSNSLLKSSREDELPFFFFFLMKTAKTIEIQQTNASLLLTYVYIYIYI